MISKENFIKLIDILKEFDSKMTEFEKILNIGCEHTFANIFDSILDTLNEEINSNIKTDSTLYDYLFSDKEVIRNIGPEETVIDTAEKLYNYFLERKEGPK